MLRRAIAAQRPPGRHLSSTEFLESELLKKVHMTFISNGDKK
jgi:hypothetical protein